MTIRYCAVILVLLLAVVALPQTGPPHINSLSPNTAVANCCISGLNMTITGTNFLSSVIVFWDGVMLGMAASTGSPTGPQTVAIQIPAGNLTTPGTHQVQIGSSAPESNPVPFTVTAPPLMLMSMYLPDATAGVPYDALLSGASGGTPPYTWSGSAPPGLTVTSNGHVSGTPTTPGFGNVSVTVTDSLGATASDSVPIAVLSNLQITTSSLPVATKGAAYTATITAGGGNPPYTFQFGDSALPPGLTLSSAGILSGVPTETGAFPLVVMVFDTGVEGSGDVASRLLTLTVTERQDPPPQSLSISAPASLPDAVLGVQYGEFLYGSGGESPYTWSISSGALPAGLRLNATEGMIAGKPTQTGSSTVTVTLTDAAGDSRSRDYTILVKPAPLAIATKSLADGRTGESYSVALAATGGVAPYAWSATGLPAGLTVDPATGIVSGLPAKAGSYSVAIRVSDAAQTSVSAELPIAIVTPALAISTASLADGTAGVPYSQTFSATGGLPPYTWSLSPTPAGLSFDASSGALSGSPASEGGYQLSVTVTDSEGARASATISLTIRKRPLQVTTASLPDGMGGRQYSATLSAVGGAEPYTWSASGLPEGLSSDASGAISGVPSAGGGFSLSVQVRDANGATASAALSLSIGAPPIASVALTGVPDSAAPAQQVRFGVDLGAGYPLSLSGRITLAFAPDSGAGVSDDPTVQFASGGRTFRFTAPPNAVSIPDTALQTGTVAGEITLTLAELRAGNVDMTPVPPLTRTIRVNAGAPVITSVQVSRTAAGFDVRVTGYSPTREVTSAAFRFVSGQHTVDVTVPVGATFSSWYGSEASRQFGSSFLYTQPFTVQGSAVTSVTVTLTNSRGTSQPATATF